jgi:hypothetical protein
VKALAALGLAAAWAATAAASPAPAPSLSSASPAPSPSASPAASPSPTPSPTPTSAGVLNLSPTLGPPGTTVTVSGSGFRTGEQASLFWDAKEKGLGAAAADGQGAFKVDVAAPDDKPGAHQVCAVEPNQVCAQFLLQAQASPTPSAPPSAAPTSQPTVAPSAAVPSPAASVAATPEARVSAVSSLLEPRFVLLPIALLLLGLAGSVLWIRLSGGRPAPVVAATVSHRSIRGTPPPEPTPPPPAPPRDPEPPRPRATGGEDILDLSEPGD